MATLFNFIHNAVLFRKLCLKRHGMYVFVGFSLSEPKAQDELLCSLIVRPSVHTFERLLLLNPWTNFLHVEPFVKGRMKSFTNGHGLLIKMAAMPICSKNH